MDDPGGPQNLANASSGHQTAIFADRVGRRPVYLFGSVVVFVMAFPIFGLLHTGSFLLVALGFVLVLNVGHNAGGLTPFVATALAGPDGTRRPLVAGYVMLGAVLSMVAVWKAPETFRRDLRTTGTPVR